MSYRLKKQMHGKLVITHMLHFSNMHIHFYVGMQFSLRKKLSNEYVLLLPIS
jgi:hypothetical protein